MNHLQAAILGIIQGLTEFLPVSSSGHLVLGQHLFGLTEPELFFDISVHMGTLAAVIIFFRREIGEIFSALFHHLNQLRKKETTLADAMQDGNIRLAIFIIAGSFPTALIGLIIQKAADRIFASVFIAGCMLLVTGMILWATRYIHRAAVEDRFSPASDGRCLSMAKALAIGAVQGAAVMPGISRSGSTIAAGLFLGLTRETAARFSFLLSIPAILGAQVLELKDLTGIPKGLGITLTGAVTAGAVGYLSLTLLIFITSKGRLHVFAPYCWIVGIAALILGW